MHYYSYRLHMDAVDIHTSPHAYVVAIVQFYSLFSQYSDSLSIIKVQNIFRMILNLSFIILFFNNVIYVCDKF